MKNKKYRFEDSPIPSFSWGYSYYCFKNNLFYFLFKYYNKGHKVLDIGCGRGNDEFAIKLKIPKMDITAIDKNKEEIDIARKKNNFNSLRFLNCSIEKSTKILKGDFDIIFSSEVLEHLNSNEIFLNSCKKLLKDGGYLIITTPLDRKRLRKLVSYFNLPQKITSFNKNYYFEELDIGHINIQSFENLKKDAKKYGFKLIEKRRSDIVAGNYWLDEHEKIFWFFLFLDLILPKKWLLGWDMALVFRKEKNIS